MEVDIRAASKSTRDLLFNTGGTLNENILLLAPIIGYFHTTSRLQNDYISIYQVVYPEITQ